MLNSNIRCIEIVLTPVIKFLNQCLIVTLDVLKFEPYDKNGAYFTLNSNIRCIEI